MRNCKLIQFKKAFVIVGVALLVGGLQKNMRFILSEWIVPSILIETHKGGGFLILI